MLEAASTGPAAAPTILFLHGGGVAGWMWRLQVAALSSTYHCLVPDLPGHGGCRSAAFAFDDAAREVEELVRQRAHGARASLVGLSLGGQLGLQLLSSAPDLFERGLISGTSVRPAPGRSLIGPAIRLSLPLNRWDWFVRANFRQLRAPESLYDDFAREARAQTADALTATVRASLDFRLPERLGGVTVPTLVLVGEREPRVVRSSAEDICDALPSARAYLVPKVGHAWNLERPELFTEVVRAWMSSEPLPKELRPLPLFALRPRRPC